MFISARLGVTIAAGLMLSLTTLAGPAANPSAGGDPVPPEIPPRVTYHNDSGTADSLCFSPDGKTIAVGSNVDVVRLVDAQTGKSMTGDVNASTELMPGQQLLWSSDGVNLGLVNRGLLSPATAAIMDAKSRKTRKTDIKDVQAAAFDHPAKLLYVADKAGGISVVEVASGKVLRKLPSPAIPRCIDVSPDGAWLAVASGPAYFTPGTNYAFNVLDSSTGAVVATFPGPDSLPTGQSACFTADGKSLIHFGKSTTLTVSDVKTRKTLREFLIPESTVAAFSPDHRRLALIEKGDFYTAVVRVIDTQTGGVYCTLSGLKGEPKALAFAGDDRTVAAAVESDVSIWTTSQPRDARPMSAADRLVGVWETTLDCDPVKARPVLKQQGITDDKMDAAIERVTYAMRDLNYVYRLKTDGTGTFAIGNSMAPAKVMNLKWSVTSDNGRVFQLKTTVAGDDPQLNNSVFDTNSSMRVSLAELNDMPVRQPLVFRRVDSDVPDKFEAETKLMISKLVEAATIMEGITDDAGAKAAAERLAAASKAEHEHEMALSHLGRSAAVQFIIRSHRQENSDANMRMQLAAMAVRIHPEWSAALNDSMQELPLQATARERELIHATAADLIGEFQKAFPAAKEKYQFKTVCIEGKLRKITPKTENTNSTDLEIVGVNQPDTEPVHLTFRLDPDVPVDRLLKDIKPGMVVVVTGGISVPSDLSQNEIDFNQCLYVKAKK